MILVTGGKCQGKRDFCRSALIKIPQDEPVAWCDGSSAAWETFMKGKYGWNFHLFIRRVMMGEAGALPGPAGTLSSGEGEGFPGPAESVSPWAEGALPGPARAPAPGPARRKERLWTPEELESLASLVVGSLMMAREDRILVTDDIGCGIVPVDYFERIWREETGRICCLAAEKSREVWRVCCGLGQRIK